MLSIRLQLTRLNIFELDYAESNNNDKLWLLNLNPSFIFWPELHPELGHVGVRREERGVDTRLFDKQTNIDWSPLNIPARNRSPLSVLLNVMEPHLEKVHRAGGKELNDFQLVLLPFARAVH